MSDELIKPSVTPSFLSVPKEDYGTEDMAKFIVPPRLKVVQPLSTGKYKEQCSPGDLVMIPQMINVVSLEVDSRGRAGTQSPGVVFTPLFFFPEFVAWNPREVKTLDMIRESSFDDRSLIAAKARDRNRRFEPCPESPEHQIRYVEHLNFVLLIHQEGLNALPAVLSFSRAEHRSGTNFMTLIKMRNAPMYGCKFVMNVKYRENDNGAWYGIDVSNPHEQIGPFVSEEFFKYSKEQFLSLRSAHESRMIRVNYDDDEGEVLEGSIANSEM